MTQRRHRMAVATHLLLTDSEGRILFMRRAGTGYADGQWSLPAGHVEAGETLAESCVREVAEETGVVLDVTDLRFLLVQHKHDVDDEERIDVFFGAEAPRCASPIIREPEKCDALIWAALESPPEPTVAYVGAALAEIRRDSGPGISYFGF